MERKERQSERVEKIKKKKKKKTKTKIIKVWKNTAENQIRKKTKCMGGVKTENTLSINN